MIYSDFVSNLRSIPNIRKNPLQYVFDNNLVRLDAETHVLEFGVFQGNTINYIASKVPYKVYGFDSFEGLPEHWDRKDMFFGKGAFSMSGLLPQVRENVRLVKGWFNDTVPSFIASKRRPITFIHMDCDIYSSTKTVFDALAHKISPDCVIVFDELVNYEGYERNGELRAFYEFVEECGVEFEYIGMNGKIGDTGCMQEKVAVKLKDNRRFKQ